MVMMSETTARSFQRLAPLPPFMTPEEVIRDSLPLLDPPNRITVTDAAERFMRIPLGGSWREFDRNITPYMVEPADTTQSRRFKTCCFVGPSQSGKTVMLQSVSMHAVMCNPGPVQVIHMTQADANAWVEEKLDPIIANSPSIRERLGSSRDDSTFSRKRFKGMRLTIGYPVANQLSSRSQRMVLLTDYDHMPQRLGPKDSPEGSPWTMALGRIKSFMSRGMVLVESTPAFPVTDLNWRADAANPNAFPPVSAGIGQIYNDGTRGRWHWECPDCEGLFEPRFDRLRYDDSLDPGSAAEGAEMVCPHCGSLIAHRHKVHLNRAALKDRGGWLHESTRLNDLGQRVLCRLSDADLRQTQIASWALDGAAAAFANWIDLVTRYEAARREYEATGDDIKMSQVYYTEIGQPYARRDIDEAGALSVQALRDSARDIPQQTCPSWARFLTTSVDTNGSWFAVAVTAWGLQGQRMLVDRFDLRQPPDGAPRARDMEGRYRSIDPGKYAEDAHVLLPLLERLYPVQGSDWSLKASAMVLDFNGPPGWSDNAEKLWRKMKRDGKGHLVFLSIGRGGFKIPDRVWYATPERGSKGKKARAIKLLNMAVDRLKDTVLAAVARMDEGPSSYPVPKWLEEDRLTELLAERRGEAGYEKRQGIVRNETLDLSVQAQALAEHRGLNKIDPASPPEWMTLSEVNSFAVWTGQGRVGGDQRVAPAPTEKRAIKWLRR